MWQLSSLNQVFFSFYSFSPGTREVKKEKKYFFFNKLPKVKIHFSLNYILFGYFVSPRNNKDYNPYYSVVSPAPGGKTIITK